jgi:hypothetical protein
MKKFWWFLFGCAALISLAVEMTQEAHHWWEKIPGFYVFFGFAGCVAIILISKALGKLLLQKKEDYYDVR